MALSYIRDEIEEWYEIGEESGISLAEHLHMTWKQYRDWLCGKMTEEYLELLGYLDE